MNVLITGATGFLGKYIVEELLKQDVHVTAIVRDTLKVPKQWNEVVDIIQYDIDKNSIEDVKEKIKNKPDIFYHFAWSGTSGNTRADYNIQLNNVKIACDMMNLAIELKCSKFINAGSIMEYEAERTFNANEKMGMGSIYSTAKMTSDYMLKTIADNNDISYINAIISNIYGVGEVSKRFINVMTDKMINNENIELTSGKQKYDFIYVTDAAAIFYLIGIKGKSGERYYIGNSNQITLKEYVIKMKNVIGGDSILEFGKIPNNTKELDYSIFDTYKVERELGYKPQITFEEGIEKIYNSKK